MSALIADPATAHQIVLRTHLDPRPYRGSRCAIMVSCTCLVVRQPGRPAYQRIETRMAFPAAEAVAAWRAWHAERGVIV